MFYLADTILSCPAEILLFHLPHLSLLNPPLITPRIRPNSISFEDILENAHRHRVTFWVHRQHELPAPGTSSHPIGCYSVHGCTNIRYTLSAHTIRTSIKRNRCVHPWGEFTVMLLTIAISFLLISSVCCVSLTNVQC